MFRKLYEGFNETPASAAEQMNKYYNYTEPGAIRSTQPTPNVVSEQARALMDYAGRSSTQRELQEATNMAVNGQVGSPWMKGFAHRFTGFRAVPKTLLDLQAQCESKPINDLVAGYDSDNVYNCGVFYDKDSDPLFTNNGVGRGYVGTASGPVTGVQGMKPVPSGAWHADPGVALKKANIAKCNTIKFCGHLSSSPYKDMCAWCGTSSAAIPVNARGQPLYSDNTCEPTRLYKNSASCPADAVPAPAAGENQVGPGGQVCENMALSRECIINQARTAGCRNDGALIMALNSGRSRTDYTDTLANNIAFNTYNTRATTRLIPEMFNAGKATIDAVLKNLQALKTETGKTGVSAAAARNLCLNSTEEIDFCKDDIDSNKSGPFALNCLQRQFRLMGGQGEGAMYPTGRNKAQYDATFATWNDVTAYFNQLKEMTESSDVATQERALRDFLGIKRESIYKPSMRHYRNYEVYNFSSASIIGQVLDGLFIGRNLRAADKGLPNFNGSVLPAEQLSQMDTASQPSFVILTDLRPPTEKQVQFAFTAKDGVVLTLNKDMTNYATEIIRSEPDDFRQNEGRPMPIYLYNNKCTTLNAGGNNRVKVYWNSRIAGALKTFKMLYTDCDRGEDSSRAKEVNQDWISMTQEPNAPMLSFEFSMANGFGEKRLPEFFPIEQNGIVAKMSKGDYDDTNTDTLKPNRPFIKFSNANSYLQVTKFIFGTSFSTISLVLNVGQAIQQNSIILTYNNMRLMYSGNAIKLGLSDSSNSASIPIQTGTWYIVVIRVSGNQSYSRNKLDLNVVPLTNARNPQMQNTIFSNTQSIVINRNNIINILDNDSRNSSLLRLGANNEMNTVSMDVVSLRLYDQAEGSNIQVSEETIAKDARNSFARNWYN